MIDPKQVFKLALEKGYDSIVCECFAEDRLPDIKGIGYFLELVMIQKWLRDKHHINIIPTPSDFIYDYAKILYKVTVYAGDEPTFHDFESYEDALLMGINEALKFIK